MRRMLAVIGAGGMLVLQGCAAPSPKPPVLASEVPEIRPGSGYLIGYLQRQDLPDSLKLLPPPPASGSAAEAADIAVYQAQKAVAPARRQAAATDAELRFPQAAQHFTCALGLPVSESAMPHLTMLLRRSLADAGLATYAAKDHYNRTRPFVQFREPSCNPAEEPRLVKDGSYPSGHSALGWAWGLLLAEVAPERADAVLKRGHDFGQSRVVCGVHWQSDVEAGRVVGAAAVARLHADPVFQAQLKEAKAEVAAARARGLKPEQSCGN